MKLIKKTHTQKKYFLITSRLCTINIIVLIKYIKTLLSKTQNVHQYNDVIS